MFPSKIFCINLDRRVDRWKQMAAQFNQHQLIVERFSAIDYMEAGIPARVAPTRSHYAVISQAKAENLPKVLIFEDDAVLHKDFNTLLRQSLQHLPVEWHMLHLAGSHLEKPQPLNDHIYRISHSYTTHAYFVRDTMYDIILDRLRDYDEPSDVLYVQLQKQYNCFVTNPPLAWQRGDYSDVEKKVMHYPWLETNEQ